MQLNAIATAIFVCVVNAVQPPLPFHVPPIVKNQSVLDAQFTRKYAMFNTATGIITMPDVWDGDDLDADFMSEMNRRATAHEFTRAAMWKKHHGQPQTQGVLPHEADCYYADQKGE